jgi:gluconokinase
MLFDRLGRGVQGVAARQSHTIRATAEGAAEADPDVLLAQVCHCLDGVMEEAGSLSSEIAGVGLCTFVSNVLGVDEQGQAVTPLTTYADTRAADEAGRLRKEFDEEAVHQRTGCLFHTSYLPARFRWLARAKPELLDRVARWVGIGEYVELQLFGKAAVSYSVASWTGLLDRRRLAWDRQLLSALPIGEEQLSPLTDISVPRQGLREPFASRWPALRDVPRFPAAGDGATANVGSGCTSPQRVALSMGNSSAMRAVVAGDVPYVPIGLWCYRVDGERSLLGGAITGGGSVFAWLCDTLQLPALEDLEPSLASATPGGHGLTMLPFLAGERSPGWAGHARAAICGLSLATTPLDILQAGMEAVAYRIGLIFDLLRPLLPDDFEVVTSGGALLSSPVWRQIVADVLNRPLVVSGVEEASARGAALLALEALGVLGELGQAPLFLGASVEPDAGRHACHVEAANRQQVLYEELVGSSL